MKENEISNFVNIINKKTLEFDSISSVTFTNLKVPINIEEAKSIFR
jgi:hypothetical protein